MINLYCLKYSLSYFPYYIIFVFYIYYGRENNHTWTPIWFDILLFRHLFPICIYIPSDEMLKSTCLLHREHPGMVNVALPGL